MRLLVDVLFRSIIFRKKEENIMAKTKSSTHGIQNKKIVTVRGYVTSNGVKVKSHRRSTPN